MASKTSRNHPAAPSSRSQLAIALLILLALAPLPELGLGIYWQGVVIMSLYFALLASNWNLLSGYTGLFSLAPATFGMLGAYVSALLWTYAGAPPMIGIPAGMFVAAFVGLLVGLLTLRLVGPYFALTTLAFAEILRIIALNSFSITNGENGLRVPTIFNDQSSYYYLFLVLVAVTLIGFYWLLGQPCGYYLRAIKNDETGARAKGVRVVFWKVFAFTVSAGLSGFAGAMLGHYQAVVSPSMGNLLVTGMIISMVVLGGMGTLLGPLLGALIVNISSEYLRSAGDLQHIVFPLLVILFARFCKEGLVGRAAMLFRPWLARSTSGLEKLREARAS